MPAAPGPALPPPARARSRAARPGGRVIPRSGGWALPLPPRGRSRACPVGDRRGMRVIGPEAEEEAPIPLSEESPDLRGGLRVIGPGPEEEAPAPEPPA